MTEFSITKIEIFIEIAKLIEKKCHKMTEFSIREEG